MADEPASRRREGTLILEGVPRPSAALVARLSPYQHVRAASLRGWHPGADGILISTRFGDTSQVHWVEQPGGSRRQLTFSAEPVGAVAVVPGGDSPRLVMSRDAGGSERYQLFVLDLTPVREQRWTDGEARYGAPTPSPDGRRLAYLATDRNGRDWDVMVRDLDGDHAATRVTSEAGSWSPEAWSPDSSSLVVSRYVSARDSRLFLCDLATGDRVPLAATQTPSFAGGARFSADGRFVYCVSDAGAEFRQLCRIALADGGVTLLSETLPWNISNVAPSPDGRYLAFVVNEGGYGRLRVWDSDGTDVTPWPALPDGIASDLHWCSDGSSVGFTLHVPTGPADVYSVSLADGRLTRWTESEAGGLDPSRLCAPTLIHYPTFDTDSHTEEGAPVVDAESAAPSGASRRRIPSWYYAAPARQLDARPAPVVIAIHGGPEGQARATFQPLVQYWVREMGLAVLQPNVRGSAGYGKTYLRLDDGRLREDSVRDIGALLDWIAEQPGLDPERVAVYGGSYGGYMVLASMIHFGDRLRGGIDVVGISNFVTFLENTGDYRRDLRRVEYGDERDPEMRAFLEAISPTTRAAEIDKPLLIAQGRNDPRVPVSEAEQILQAVRDNGGDPWYFLAEDEGHGFQKKVNRDAFDRAVVMFLERILRSGPPSP